VSGKQIKSNKHINWAEKSQDYSWKQGDWEIQYNHALPPPTQKGVEAGKADNLKDYRTGAPGGSVV